MSRLSNLQAIKDLPPKEAEVIFHKCQGLSHQEIADLLYKSIKTVNTQSSSGLKKLGIDTYKDVDGDERVPKTSVEIRAELHRLGYCDLLDEFVRNTEEFVKYWPKVIAEINLEIERLEAEGIEEEVEETGEVDEVGNLPPPPTTPIDVSPPPDEEDTQPLRSIPPEEPEDETDEPPIEITQPGDEDGNGDGDGEVGELEDRGRRNLYIGISIGLVLIISICCCVAYFRVLPIAQSIIDTFRGPTSPTEIPVTTVARSTPTETLIPSDTPLPTLTPTITLTPTETERPTITLTSTNTNTPRPTNTPLPSPTPIPILFEDNFDRGKSDEWNEVFGDATVANLMLVAQEDTLLSIGDESWTNYEVTFDLYPVACNHRINATFIGVRASDVDNMVALGFAKCNSQWYRISNGNWSEVSGTLTGNLEPVPLRIRIVADGGFFAFYNSGAIESSFVDEENYKSGKVFIRLVTKDTIDNFKIVALP